MSEKRAVHMKGIRNQILRTAEKLFLTQGYKTTTIRQIVQESGITSGSIYNIFEDKEHLFSALVDEFLTNAKAKIDKALEGQPAENRMVGLLGMELYITEKNPVVRELMCAFHTSPFLMETVIKRHSTLAEEVWAGRRHPRNSKLSTAILLSEGAVSSYRPMSFPSISPRNWIILKSVGKWCSASSGTWDWKQGSQAALSSTWKSMKHSGWI